MTKPLQPGSPGPARARAFAGRLALLALCWLLGCVSVAQSQENGGEVFELSGVRLELPENWQALAAFPDSPLRLELLREDDALFLGGAIAQADQAFTLFSLAEISLTALGLPPDFDARALLRLARKEQDELRAGLERRFTAELQRLTGFEVEQRKTMLNHMNGRDMIMLTARCRKGGEALIVNQVYYFPAGRILALTFVSPPDIISFIAPDIAHILERFNPESGGSSP